MASQDITLMLLSLGVLLGAARLLGGLALWLRQPVVVGEILAGVLLGPTVLGAFLPELNHALFPLQGSGAWLRDGLITLAMAVFLFDAGIEVDLEILRRQKRTVLAVGAAGLLVPFALGFGFAQAAPQVFGFDGRTAVTVFALFIGTALAITALPVIVKILQDIGQFTTDLGTVIIGSAILIDLLGWMIFSLVLGLNHSGGPVHTFGPATTVLLTLAFAALMLTVGRKTLDELFAYLQARAPWQGALQSFALVLACLAGALTEWIGAKAFIGAFLVGVAAGDSAHLTPAFRTSLKSFVSSAFAPIFFASIGLRVDFGAHFDWQLALVLLVVGSAGKLLGCTPAARLCGMSTREAWAIGCGMNARGAMEIVLGFVALQYGLIGEPVFVALVFVALTTSIVAGPLMQRLLARPVRDATEPEADTAVAPGLASPLPPPN